jgi:hypothetical protein
MLSGRKSPALECRISKWLGGWALKSITLELALKAKAVFSSVK